MASTQELISAEQDVQDFRAAIAELEGEATAQLDPDVAALLDKAREIDALISSLELTDADTELTAFTPLLSAARTARSDLTSLWDDFASAQSSLQSSVDGGALEGIFTTVQGTTQDAVPFCDDYPEFAASGEASISLVFGLPEIQFDITCRGIHLAVPDLVANLSAVFPIIQIADCIMKVIAVVQAIPDSIGPPPDPTILIEKIGELAGCITLLLEFSVFGAIPAFCKFIRDLINFLIEVLNCIVTLLTINVEQGTQIAALNASVDVRLQEMGVCLQQQSDALQAEADYKFNAVEIFINILNIMLAVMPPPVGGGPPIVITTPLQAGLPGIQQIQDIIDILEAARQPFDACAGP